MYYCTEMHLHPEELKARKSSSTHAPQTRLIEKKIEEKYSMRKHPWSYQTGRGSYTKNLPGTRKENRVLDKTTN